jgi:hypothetical protein
LSKIVFRKHNIFGRCSRRTIFELINESLPCFRLDGKQAERADKVFVVLWIGDRLRILLGPEPCGDQCFSLGKGLAVSEIEV